MKKNFIYLTLLLTAILPFTNFKAFSQIPGFINRPATIAAGRLVLDPNSDGYTSLTTAGFGIDDVANSELLYNGIKAYSIEPFGDLRRGPNHNYSDFVPDASGNGVYHRFAAGNIMFRMRMGSVMPGSKGYSIMMDTDGKFGASGPNADANYLPSTTGTNGNPGFEIEIVLETNFRIAIYNVDGTSSPVLVKQYLNWQEMSQISIASTNDNGDPDFLIDFYIPFSDLTAAPFNLTASSPIRMCATTVMSPQAAIGGPRSDIYGTAGDTYEDFILGQPACNIFNNPVSCSTAMCTAAPNVNSPISTGTVNISGTWTKSVLPLAVSTATITVYKNAVSVGTVANVTSGSVWTLNSISVAANDVITAKAQATGESICLVSNSVIASLCNASNITATSNAAFGVCVNDRRGMAGTKTTNAVIKIYSITAAGGPVLFATDGTPTSPSTYNLTYGTVSNVVNTTWEYNGSNNSGSSDPCSGGPNDIPDGSYFITVTTSGLCESAPIWGSCVNLTATATPVITQTTLYRGNALISGTAVSGSTVFLYVNGRLISSQTATGGNYSFSNVALYLNDQVQIVAQATGNCISSAVNRTVSCFTNAALINADNNNQITAGSPITGTSSETVGTTIRVYNSSGPSLVATTTVQAGGIWSTAAVSYNAVAGTSYYVNAQNGSCSVSANSGTVSAASTTNVNRCGTITGPVAAGAASISGTLTGSLASTTVNLYLDGQLIGSNVTSGAAWGPITVNSTINNTLYSNGVLSIGIQESGKQEVLCPASSLAITCSPTPVAPLYSPSSITINQNQTVTYTISNAVAGSFYAVADSTTGQSLGQGKWAIANGNLSITTNQFTTAGTYKVLFRSTSLSGVTLCTAASASGTIIVNPVVLPVTLLSFKGKKQADVILLDWTTANESQVNRFEVERSSNGSAYEKIGLIAAIGNSNTNKAYSFTDAKPLSKLNYYRLKMIDNDGKFSYSNVIAFAGNQSKGIIVSNVKPNPFIETINLNIVLQQIQLLNIQLIDMSGRVVLTRDIQAKEGNNDIRFDRLGNLSEGIYFIKIITPDAVLQQKVLKVNGQ